METRTKVNALRSLRELGQSPWYDNIDRRLIVNSELKKLIENGITGLTSNPTIFEKAVAASSIYNEQIKNLSKEGRTAKEIYDEITVADVRDAADLLSKIYLKSDKMDGYVSIEVYPEYAHDSERTIAYARAIYKRIGRNNIMIKVPATKESRVAIRTLIREGIRVNATLIFSVEHYERAALAYIDGLNDRLRDGKILKEVTSVASVFISRIDTYVDRLADKKDASLKGKAAVANTKMIYRRFKELFGDKSFGKLKKAGARIQRPLWASTSTKDPAYSDIKYVEELVGKDTINTIPHSTMEAYLDHGRPRLTVEDDIEGAKDTLKKLAGLGIDITSVCQAIQDDGVTAFQGSFDKLIESISRGA